MPPQNETLLQCRQRFATDGDRVPKQYSSQEEEDNSSSSEKPAYNLVRRMSQKWCTGAGARIGCVREYPAQLQLQALQHVNLSPRLAPAMNGPIPSPRPSPRIHLSPRVAHMGLPSPRVH
ncbi:hypothetical protein M569_07678 [Genlisea aurea]|uniref:Uncharacterized protein n=1 Tax=Genlisea aurea TaxID=192259 RepID=S8CK76_9LAMI|nr:hypothetical protein M569_07678 [Genlisea aurea]